MDILVLQREAATPARGQLDPLMKTIEGEELLGSTTPHLQSDVIKPELYRGRLKNPKLIVQVTPDEVPPDLRRQHADLEHELTDILRKSTKIVEAHVLIVMSKPSEE